MEKRIYGPDGTVARRVVSAGGPSTSTVYKDPDSGRTLVHRVTDAEPALRAAAHARSEGGQKLEHGRLMGYMPENDYFKMVKEARRESTLAGGGYADILARKKREYFARNSLLRA